MKITYNNNELSGDIVYDKIKSHGVKEDNIMKIYFQIESLIDNLTDRTNSFNYNEISIPCDKGTPILKMFKNEEITKESFLNILDDIIETSCKLSERRKKYDR